MRAGLNRSFSHSLLLCVTTRHPWCTWAGARRATSATEGASDHVTTHVRSSGVWTSTSTSKPCHRSLYQASSTHSLREGRPGFRGQQASKHGRGVAVGEKTPGRQHRRYYCRVRSTLAFSRQTGLYLLRRHWKWNGAAWSAGGHIVRTPGDDFPVQISGLHCEVRLWSRTHSKTYSTSNRCRSQCIVYDVHTRRTRTK